MALTKVTGNVVKTTTDLTINNLTGVAATFTGNVSVGGTLTYEDVTSIEAVGIITAKNNIDAQKDVLVGAGLSVVGISTFNNDVTFTGATSGRNAFWDKSENSLELGDYTYLKFGTDEDLTVWSHNTYSALNNKTGELRIPSAGNVRILKRHDGSGAFAAELANFKVDGAVELFNAGNKKFETSSTGVSITGIPVATQSTGNIGLELHATGNSRGSQTKYHNDHGEAYVGTAGDTTGNFLVHNTSNTHMLFATNNTERLRIDSAGRLLIGTTTEGNSVADDLTIAGSGDSGITIRSGTSNEGSLMFSDGTSGGDEYRGWVCYNHNSNFMRFFTNATERLRIDAGGRVLANHTASVGSGKIQAFASQDAVDILSYSTTNTHGGRLTFYRSKNATIGSNTEVADGDSLGRIDWRGYNDDGTTYNQGARIEALVSGNVDSSTDMPTDLVFKTSPNGSATPSEVLRLKSEGGITFQQGNTNYPTDFIGGASNGRNYVRIKAGNTTSGHSSGFKLNHSDGNGVISMYINHNDDHGHFMNEHQGGDILFYTNASGSSLEKLRITSDGKVSIGFNAPAVHGLSLGYSSTSRGFEFDTGSGFGSSSTVRAYYRPGTAYNNLGLTGATILFGINDVEKARIDSGGRTLIGGTTSSRNESKLQVHGTSDTNYIVMQNTSASDTDGNRYGKFIYRGTQSGGEVSDLVHLQGEHDGSADDQKGRFIIKVNDGNDGNSSTETVRVSSNNTVHIGKRDGNSNTTHWGTSRLNIVGPDPIATGVSRAASYLAIGNNESEMNGVYPITFGYTNNNNTHQPAYIAYKTTNSSSAECGALLFGTRNVVTDTQPSERMRLTADGNLGINEATPDFSGFGGNGGGIELDDVNSGFTCVKVSHGGSDLYFATSGGGGYISTRTNSMISIETNSTERINISNGGNVRIRGTTAQTGTSGGSLGLDLHTGGGTSIPIYFGSEQHSAQKSIYLSGYWMQYRGHVNEGHQFIFSQSSGNAPHSDKYTLKYNSALRPGNSNTWDGFSDSRAKQNVQTVTNGIATIKQLRAVKFDWTDDYADATSMYIMEKDENGKNVKAVKENGYDTTKKNNNIGFIAQEYETVFPKDVKEHDMKLGDQELTDFKTINEDSLIPMLTAALKEAIAKIETLETKVAALESS